MLKKTFWREIGVAVFYFAALFIIRPQIFHKITTHYFGGDRYDAGIYGWIVSQLLKKSVFNPASWLDLPFFYPLRNSLAFSDSFIVPALLTRLLTSVVGNSVLAYNICLIGACFLNGYVTYLLVRYLTKSTLTSLYAGFCFMSSPFLLWHLGHPQLQFAFFVPLTILLCFKFIERPSCLSSFALGCSLVICFTCSVYYSLTCILLSGLIFLSCIILGWTPFSWLVVRKLFLPNLPSLFVFMRLLQPYIATRNAIGSRLVLEIKTFSNGILSYFSAPPSNLLWGTLTKHLSFPEAHLFPGALILGLVTYYFVGHPLVSKTEGSRKARLADLLLKLLIVVLFIQTIASEILKHEFKTNWTAISDALPMWGLLLAVTGLLAFYGIGHWFRNTGISNNTWSLFQENNLPLRLLLLFVAVFFAFVSMGIPKGASEQSSLFGLLYLYFPGFSGIRAPGRLGVVVLFCLVCMASLLVNDVLRKINKTAYRYLVVTVLFLISAFEFRSSDLPVYHSGPTPAIYQLLKEQNSLDAAVAFPVYTKGEMSLETVFNQTNSFVWISQTGHPAVNGYSGIFSAVHDRVYKRAMEFPDRQSIAALSSIYGLRYVVYHPKRDLYFNKIVYEQRLEESRDALTEIGRDNSSNVLYELTPTFYSKSNEILLPTNKEDVRLSLEARIVAPSSRITESRKISFSMPMLKSSTILLEDSIITNDSWKPVSFTVIHSHEKVLPLTVLIEIPELKEGESLQLRKR